MNELTHATRHISASMEDLTDAVLDIEAYPSWATQITRAEVVVTDAEGGPVEAELRMDAGLIKDVLRLRYTVTRASRAATIAWTLVSARQLRSLDGRYDIASGEQGCDVTYTLRVDPGIPLITALRQKAESAVVSAALDDLEREVKRRIAVRASAG